MLIDLLPMVHELLSGNNPLLALALVTIWIQSREIIAGRNSVQTLFSQVLEVVKNNTTAFSDLQSVIEDLNHQVAELKEAVNSLKTQVEHLESKVA